MKIALVRLSALGDAVCCIPLVHALQRAFPEADVTWVVSRAIYPLFAGLSGVRFVVLDKPRSLKNYVACWRVLRREQFDVLLATHASFRVNWLYPMIKAARKIGFDKKRARDGQWLWMRERIVYRQNHYVNMFLQFAEKLGVQDLNVEWGLPVHAVDFPVSVKKIIAIHPGASVVTKQWPLNNYIALIKRLLPFYEVVLLGVDLALGEAISAQAPVNNLIGQVDLTQLAGVLQRVDLFVSPDTGPLHVAVAVGTPVLGLYAATDPRLSGPYQGGVVNCYRGAFGERHYREGVMARITVDEVVAQCELLMGAGTP